MILQQDWWSDLHARFRSIVHIPHREGDLLLSPSTVAVLRLHGERVHTHIGVGRDSTEPAALRIELQPRGGIHEGELQLGIVLIAEEACEVVIQGCALQHRWIQQLCR